MQGQYRWFIVFLGMVFCVSRGDAQDGGWDMSGLLGTVTVNNEQWQRLDMQPRFQIGAFEAMFDLELFLDNEGRLRDRGWDFTSRRKGLESVLRKIHYMKYGDPYNRDRRLYVRMGTLESVTLGSGL